jgi:diguanylate cyclase (GGDEF)-like protein
MSPHLAVGLSEVFGIVGLTVAPLLIGLRRHVNTVTLNAALAALTVLVSILVARTGAAAGVVLPGAFYMCIALTAAYFFPPSQARAHSWLAASGFSAGVLACGVPNLIVPWFMVTVALLGAAEMLRHLVAQLRQQAALDPLTGLANRGYFRLVAERELALAGRGGARFSVALLDLDDFKAVNDTHGHAAGDTLLIELAAAWQAQLRRSDLLARYGGDEFALIMPDTGRDEGVRVLERLHAAHPAQWSAGVATWDDEADLNQLLRRADDDLYRSKNSRAR